MSHGIKWIEGRDDNWKKCQHLKVPNSLDSGVPHMFRIISHKSWWPWMVNFSPSAKWLQHLRQESRRKLLEFLDLHPKWNPATKTQQKRSSSKQSLKSKMHQKTLTWSPKAMTSIFEGRKLCLFQPKQGSFGFQAYILCIYIYIYLILQWDGSRKPPNAVGLMTWRAWKSSRKSPSASMGPWSVFQGLDQIPNPNNALLREILSKLLYICIWGFPKMVAPNNHGFSY